MRAVVTPRPEPGNDATRGCARGAGAAAPLAVPSDVVALQRAAGNRATGTALRKLRRVPRTTVARDLWGSVTESLESAWDAVTASLAFEHAKGEATAAANSFAADQTAERRLGLIRAIKRAVRVASSRQVQELHDTIDPLLGGQAPGTWSEAGTAFGGYTGMFPGFAPDIRRELTKLGASDTVSFGTFELTGSGGRHRTRATAIAGGEISDLERTDIIYFRGHQFAQYRAPGLFSDGSETRGFDLRYVDKAGGFPNVKLMISTSCATLCHEAFDVFHRLFPNAVLLGYRKSAPLHGEQVLRSLLAEVKAIGRPLLLDEAADMTAITDAWKKVIEKRHKGDMAQLPGFYDGSTVHFWDGKAWDAIAPTGCRHRPGRRRGGRPAPRADRQGSAGRAVTVPSHARAAPREERRTRVGPRTG